MYDSNTDLVAKRTATAPVIDGAVDAVWGGAIPLGTFSTGNSGNYDVYLRAMFDDDYIYLLASWDEYAPAQADKDRDAWELTSNMTPGTWDHKVWGEDRLSFLFMDPDDTVEGFDTQGCDAICHNDEDMYTKNAGEMLDAWVWSAATTNPQGYADDGVLLNNNTVTPDPTKMHVTVSDLAWDAGAEGWIVNNDTQSALPRPTHIWKPTATPTDPSIMYGSDADQVNWATFDITTVPTGAMVPGHVLKTPGGDRASVLAKGVHNGTGWNLELRRPRDTLSTDDVAFDDTNVPYWFGLSVANNRTGADHSKSIKPYALWLAEPEEPDLVVKRINPIGTDFTVDSTMQVGVFIENIGWADAGACQLAWWWDTGGLPSPTYVDVDPIAWGETDYYPLTVSTHGLSPGNNTFYANVDNQGDVAEINETNNVNTLTVDLAAERLPDLEVTAIEVDPAEVPWFSLFDVTVTVLNNGTNASSGGLLQLHLDDVVAPLDEWSLADLAPGATDQFTWQSGLFAGDKGLHTLKATVDPLDDVRELDEGDNVLTHVFNVTEPTRPDLVVQSVLPLTTSVTQGADTQTKVVVANEGGSAVTASFEVALFMDQAFTVGTVGLLKAQVVDDDVPAGGTLEVNLTWTVPEDAAVGKHFIRAQVDWTGGIDELDEGNNNATFQDLVVMRMKLPDLVIDSVSPANPDAKLETWINLSIVVKNTGTLASSTTTLNVTDATHSVASLPRQLIVPVLDINETVAVYLEWLVTGVPEGDMIIQLEVDAENLLREESEFNNAFSVRLTVLPADLADLWVPDDGVTFSPAGPRIGDAVTISITVENKGTMASENASLWLFLGNNRISDKDLLVLGVGESRDIDIIWAARNIVSPNEYTLSIQVDPTFEVKELNETNNDRDVRITFVKRPEPVLENLVVSVSKATIITGKQVTVTVSVDNTGDESDLISIVVTDRGTEAASSQGVIVPQGGNKTETFTFKVTGTGAHDITVTLYRGTEVIKDPSGADLAGTLSVKVKKKDENPGYGSALALLALLGAVVAIASLRRRG